MFLHFKRTVFQNSFFLFLDPHIRQGRGVREAIKAFQPERSSAIDVRAPGFIRRDPARAGEMSRNKVSDHDWQEEANSVIRDIEQHVQKISVADLPNTKNEIYFNLTTLENKDFCVELSQEGFRIVGEKYNSNEKRGKYSVFETPYSMLDSLSPAYRDSFSEELLNKLNHLQKEREESRRDDSSDSDDSKNA